VAGAGTPGPATVRIRSATPAAAPLPAPALTTPGHAHWPSLAGAVPHVCHVRDIRGAGEPRVRRSGCVCPKNSQADISDDFGQRDTTPADTR
jgi:hypothetical protein